MTGIATEAERELRRRGEQMELLQRVEERVTAIVRRELAPIIENLPLLRRVAADEDLRRALKARERSMWEQTR